MAKNKVTKKLLKICEDNRWTVDGPDKYDNWELAKFSPAGEDFFITITAKTNEDFISAIEEWADNFNPDEHAVEWYGKHMGEPDSLRELLDDADAIQAMLYGLVERLREEV